MAQAHFIQSGSFEMFFRSHSKLHDYFPHFRKMYAISSQLSFQSVLLLRNYCFYREDVYYIFVEKFLAHSFIYIYFCLCSVIHMLLAKNHLQVVLRWPLLQYGCWSLRHTVGHFTYVFQTGFINAWAKFQNVIFFSTIYATFRKEATEETKV